MALFSKKAIIYFRNHKRTFIRIEHIFKYRCTI